ncbi:MAG: CHASE2 domain-containing protein, partial [Acidobacteria bacterium]|nr:CHASE2 domain-containing protein [Acidobacteriota bacterium]
MRKLVVGIAIGASAFLATMGLQWLGVFDDVELAAFDRRLIATHNAGNASKDIVIIEINESSMDALEPVFGRWPWPRMVHAGVIDFVAR